MFSWSTSGSGILRPWSCGPTEEWSVSHVPLKGRQAQEFTKLYRLVSSWFGRLSDPFDIFDKMERFVWSLDKTVSQQAVSSR